MSIVIFENMIGKVMVSVDNIDNCELVFKSESGSIFKFYHEQDCCESVSIEDICGDLNDLIGKPIIEAEEISSEHVSYDPNYNGDCSSTWTFYKFSTINGNVVVRWLGESNGYYSESVNYREFLTEEDK